MKTRIPPLSIDVRTVNALIHDAVSNRNLSLNQIARMSGLSVPTIARIYHSEGGTVHPRTAKALEEALSGEPPMQKPRFGLTKGQENRIISEVVKVLRTELGRC